MNDKKRIKLNLVMVRIFGTVAVLVWPAAFAIESFQHLWILPTPSDPLQYLGPAIWGNSYAYFLYIDRIMLLNGLRVFEVLFQFGAETGPAYILTINILTLMVSAAWLYYRSGITSAVSVVILLATSFYYLGYATYLYPNQTVAFYAIMALISFDLSYLKNGGHRIQFMILAGVFCAFAVFSKGTGISVIAYIGLMLLFNRDYRGLYTWAGGIIGGSVVVVSMFVGLFGWSSLVNCLGMVLNQNNQYISGRGLTNVVPFIDVFLNPLFFPGFLGLIVLPGIYSHRASRSLAIAAWLSIATTLFIYAVSQRGGHAIPHYIYTGYILSCLAQASFIGIELQKRFDLKNIRAVAIVMCSSTFILGCAILFHDLSSQWVLTENFDIGHVFGIKYLDLFDPKLENGFSVHVRSFYLLGPFFVLVSYVWFSNRLRPLPVFILLSAAAIWGTGYSNVVAHAKAKMDQAEAKFFYDASELLSRLPPISTSIYVEQWHPHKQDRILWVYRLFFFDRKLIGDSTDSQMRAEKFIENQFSIYDQLNHLQQTTDNTVLTDSMEQLRLVFPNAVTKKTYFWSGEKDIYLADLNKDREIYYDLMYQLSETEAIPTEPIIVEKDTDKNKVKVLHENLEVCGIRGKFRLGYLYDATSRYFQIQLVDEIGDESTILLCFDVPTSSTSSNIELRLQLVSSDQPANLELFVQDKQESWEKVVVSVDAENKRNTYVRSRIRPDASKAFAGIAWTPENSGDVLNINQLEVFRFSGGFDD